jgi:hypothetical protein
MTWIAMVCENEPLALRAVTLYDLVFCQKLGLPEISPVEVFKRKPLGRAGLTLYERIAPPVLLAEATVVLTEVLRTAFLVLIVNLGLARGVAVGEGVGAR